VNNGGSIEADLEEDEDAEDEEDYPP